MVFGKVLRSVHPFRHFAEISQDLSILLNVIFAPAWYRELDVKTGAIECLRGASWILTQEAGSDH